MNQYQEVIRTIQNADSPYDLIPGDLHVAGGVPGTETRFYASGSLGRLVAVQIGARITVGDFRAEPVVDKPDSIGRAMHRVWTPSGSEEWMDVLRSQDYPDTPLEDAIREYRENSAE